MSMKKLFLILFFGLTLGGCTLKSPFLKKPAGLEINTTPPAAIFLNGQEVGTTPYKQTDLAPGDYQLKLVPQGSEPFPSWETELSLKGEVTTIVNRSFASTETDSAGHILELHQEPSDNTFLSIISDPDTVNLLIDGKPHGYTPVTKIDTTPGAHQLSLSSPGYKPLDLSINAVKGYNLIVNAKLAADTILLTSPPPSTGSATLTPDTSLSSSLSQDSEDILPPYVLIKDTGTGWLRVRSEPSSSGEELGKADVGEKLKYLGETSETGWHQVEFEGATGWLSAKYSELVK